MRYIPGQKLKLKLDISDKSDKENNMNRICTVVRQYPHIVHITYQTVDGATISLSMTPWEIEHRLIKGGIR